MSTTPKAAGKRAASKKLPQPPIPENFDTMVAEAAYYLAEQRGFCPGCELDDWLAAEAQVRYGCAPGSETPPEPPPVGAK